MQLLIETCYRFLDAYTCKTKKPYLYIFNYGRCVINGNADIRVIMVVVFGKLDQLVDGLSPLKCNGRFMCLSARLIFGLLCCVLQSVMPEDALVGTWAKSAHNLWIKRLRRSSNLTEFLQVILFLMH